MERSLKRAAAGTVTDSKGEGGQKSLDPKEGEGSTNIAFCQKEEGGGGDGVRRTLLFV